MHILWIIFFSFFCSLAFSEEAVSPQFNTEAQTEIKGVILSVEKYNVTTQPVPTVMILVRTQKAVIPVEIGPEWYLKSQGLSLSSSDEVKIKGSLIKVQERFFMIASEISLDDVSLKLRDEKGMPLWKSWRDN